MNMVLSFEESVKGTTKVKNILLRPSNMIENVFVQPVMARGAVQGLSLKSVELVQVLELRLSNRVCL